MKFGLTFQSPADARAFDRGIRRAMEDIKQGERPAGAAESERQRQRCDVSSVVSAFVGKTLIPPHETQTISFNVTLDEFVFLKRSVEITL